MKRILALLLALVMLFCLTACGGDEAGTPTGENIGATTNTTENTNDPTDGTQGNTQGSTENTVDGTQGDTQGTTESTTGNTTGGGNTQTGTNPSTTTPSNTQPSPSTGPTNESTGETTPDTSYLILEKQSGGYSVTGIASNGPSNMTIPNKYEGLPVISIGDAAGMNCTNLSSVTLPNSITRVDSRAFWGCSSLNSIVIPNSVTTVGDSAFYQCTNLSSVTISNKVTVIADDLFGWCSNLSNINIPSGVTKIGNTAFIQCKKLKSITLPSSLTKIENNAFESSGLTTITIPNSVNSLGYCVFANCKNLTSVTIGKGISRIPDGTFTGCTSLTSITFTGTKAQWKNISLGDDWNGSVPATKVTCSDGTISLTGNTDPTPSNPTPTDPQPVRVSGVQISKTTLSLKVGDTQQLTATVSPSNADNRNVTWSSSNSSVAQVSSTGKITAKGEGAAVITVTTKDGGYTASCNVTVSVIHVNGVSLNQTALNMTVGKSQQLTATVSPSNADNKNVTWASSNSSVAQVSSTGKVTAKGKGSATITVTTADGNYSATCTITVTEPPLTVSISMGVGYYMGSSGSVRGVFAEANASGGSGNYVEYYIKVYYNGQLVAEGAEDEMIVTLANGTYTAEVYVKDSSGNEATASKSFTCQGY